MSIDPISDALNDDVLPAALAGGFGASSLVNAPPIASNDSFTVTERAVVRGSLFADNGHGTDRDPEGGALRVVAVQGQASYVGLGLDLIAGQVRVLSNGSFWFDTTGDFSYLTPGESVRVSFNYTVADTGGATATATATVTITGLNDAPIAKNDVFETVQGTMLTGDLFADNGAGPDRDPEFNAFSVREVNNSQANVATTFYLEEGGRLTVNGGGKFWFNPLDDFDYLDEGETTDVTFTYAIRDSLGAKATAAATVTVTGFNDAPVAQNDDVAATEGVKLAGDLFADNGFGVDYDAEGDAFSVVDVNGVKANVGTTFFLAEGGQLTVNAGGKFWFNPLSDFGYLGEGEVDTVSFTYGIRDSRGGYDNATVEIEVTGVGYPPVTAQPDTLAVKESWTARSVDLLANDYEIPSDEPEVVSVSFATSGPGSYDGPIGGTLTLDADGRRVFFDPAGEFDYLRRDARAEFDFTYVIEDRNGDRSTATVDVIVVGENDAPFALDDHFVWSLSGVNAEMNVFDDNGFGADYDIDIGDTLIVGGIGRTSSDTSYSSLHPGAGGVVSVDRHGVVHLDPLQDEDPRFDNGDLEAGEQVKFVYKTVDDFGALDRAEVIIDIIA